MVESMKQYDMQAHLDEFEKWLNENGLYCTSVGTRNRALTGFKNYLTDIKDENNTRMFSDLSCKFSWESWVSVATIFREHWRIKCANFSGIDKPGRGMAGYYLQFILDTFLGAQIKPASALSDMPYLKKLFSEKQIIDLSCILARLILFESNKSLSLDFSRRFINSGGRESIPKAYKERRLSKSGLHFYYAKTIFLARWSIQEEQKKMLAEVNKFLKEQDNVWEIIFNFASTLNNAWEEEDGYNKSGTQWIILQLLSVKQPQNQEDDVFQIPRSSEDLLTKVSQLLLRLLAEQFQLDGKRFSEPYITESDITDLDKDSRNFLLALSPFQQMDIIDFAILKKGSTDSATSEPLRFCCLTTRLNTLIQKGFLWIKHGRTQYLKVVPLSFKLTHHPDSRKITELWDDANHSFFHLLRPLLDETLKRQQKLLTTSTDSDLADNAEFSVYTELQFILVSFHESAADKMLHIQRAEELRDAAAAYLNSKQSCNWNHLILVIAQIYNEDTETKITKKVIYDAISQVVKILAHCYGVQTLSMNPAQIASGYDCLHQLWMTYKYMLQQWNSPFLCNILNKSTNRFEDSDFHLMKATRLLEAVNSEYEAADDATKQEKQVEWHRYLVSAESAALDVRQGDYDTDRTLAIRSSCLRIKALVLQKKIGGVTDKLTIVRNYALPCLKEFVFCQTKLFAGAQVTDADRKLIEAAIDTYENETFHKISLPDLEPLAFTLVTNGGGEADHYAKQVMELISQYEKALNGSIKDSESGISGGSSPSVSIWPESKESHSTCRRFYQNWYLSGLDSVVVSESDDTKDNAKRYIMRHLLEAQNIVLSTNQILDSACIRELAHDSAFLWALKTGRISVSLYGGFDRLTNFAASLMKKTYGTAGSNAFKWSSLPALDHVDAHRNAIEACLLDPLNAEKRSRVSSEIGEQAIQFIDAVRILDEAIPHFHRNEHFQRGGTPNMMKLLSKRYEAIDAERRFPELHKLHNAIQQKLGDNAFRTDYLDLLKRLRESDRSAAASILGIELSGLDEALLDKAVFTVNDVYNTMLANRCAGTTGMKEFIYTSDEQALVPYEETKRLSHGGCTKYGLIAEDTPTGSGLDFAEVARLSIEISRILSKNPLASPAAIIKDLQLGSADPLSYTELEYPDGFVLRLEHSVTKVDNNVLNHKLADPQSTGIAYTETK